ncbi:hypothetical protein FSP39_005524 [Pinctada imbricata]|uniref:G-protein coupled receptors family 1 profile domain-containing protein n=1 Tax=Pinctada imbricata TaxID=66713 RepID=A0AA88YDW5_PINIB|nr:hypothetical protein FSP39_005524 [Pinctada imbricata]
MQYNGNNSNFTTLSLTNFTVSVLENVSSSASNMCVQNNLLTSANQSAPTPVMEFSAKYATIHGYLSVFVCLFGLIANIANVVVLTRKNMVSSTNVILTWLAIADLGTMLTYFPFAMHFYILKDPQLQYYFTRGFGWVLFLLFHASFSIVCHTIAIWLTIALAIFRFLYIWFPTKGMIYCNIRRAKIAIALVIVSTVILCIPNYIMNKLSEMKTEACVNGSLRVVDLTYTVGMRQGTPFYDFNYVFNYWIQATCVKLIPCVMLTLLTILLIIAMHQAHKKRMALKNQGKKDESDRHGEHNRTTLMLLAVVILFLITEFPQGILTLCNIFIDKFYEKVYTPLGDLLDIMALCNNAINFVLYCSMSKQFRDTFISIFCKCCPDKRPGWRKMGVVSSVTNGLTTKTTTTHV